MIDPYYSPVFKSLILEASGERVVYARAVRDNVNVYDAESLNFKVGETILVWKFVALILLSTYPKDKSL